MTEVLPEFSNNFGSASFNLLTYIAGEKKKNGIFLLLKKK